MYFSHALWAAALTAIFIAALATIPRRLTALRRYRRSGKTVAKASQIGQTVHL